MAFIEDKRLSVRMLVLSNKGYYRVRRRAPPSLYTINTHIFHCPVCGLIISNLPP